MISVSSQLKGILLAVIVLAVEIVRHDGMFFMFIPVMMMTYLTFSFPVIALWFLYVYSAGMVVMQFLFVAPPTWAWPELLALWFLYSVPFFVKERHNKTKSTFDQLNDAKKKDFEEFRTAAEALRKENLRIDKQLREIGHLYDVIKDLGSTLNAQEMLDLIKEFTDRMFDLPHFVIAIVSGDNKKYDIRVTSGCDESFLRRMEVDVDGRQLLALMARDKKPLLIANVMEDPRFEKLRDLSIESFLFIPFVIQDRVIGFLWSYSNEKDFLNQEKFANFQVFFNQIAIGLQKSLLYEKVQKLSITDGLTKLYSHRYFKQRLEEELVLAGRYASPLSLLIMDIDHFKRYNDTYGHVAGDHVLMQVASILKEQTEVTHLVARYGGEEMVVIAPETTKDKAVELAERIRLKIGSHIFAVGSETTNVTVSIGVATFPKDADGSVELISHADKALYAAKNQGRNRVITYPV